MEFTPAALLHKDYCGPYISDGKFQGSVCGKATARSSEEQCCKEHDCCYYSAASPTDFTTCDSQFVDCNKPLNSYTSSINSFAVNHGGSFFHSNNMDSRKRSHSESEYSASDYYGDPNGYTSDYYAFDTPSVTPLVVPDRPRKKSRNNRVPQSSLDSVRKKLLFTLPVDSLYRRRRWFSKLSRSERRMIARRHQRRWRMARASHNRSIALQKLNFKSKIRNRKASQIAKWLWFHLFHKKKFTRQVSRLKSYKFSRGKNFTQKNLNNYLRRQFLSWRRRTNSRWH